MGNYLMKIVLFVAVAIFLLFFSIRFLEKKSLYFPVRKIESVPRDTGLDYEEVFVTTKDGIEISAWFIPSESSRATILFSHGNGGNISHRLEKMKILNDLDLDIFIFDYRGYGMSKGNPSEEGLYLDAEAVYDYLVNEKKIPARKIVGYGESLGGAVIIDLASKRELGGIIIEGSFTSIRDMAKKYFPFIPAFVYRTSFDSFEKIKNIKSPKLHFHSISDEIVPFELGKKLFDNALEPKEFVELQGGHNDAFIISQDVFITGIDLFLHNL
ncbi:MAG TPA: alpha/beta hydrolase [Nitrospirae bacterium]|nr:alpha/beta hydrolase family protein [bacterium BMS3Abin06]HDH13508.1 alpha/beta hydrolase [Nitrospirota bacterium]HDZ01052.1 alpha/beta hydrolase [Nitrospirota bacterium]